MPNDKEEQERLGLQYYIHSLLLAGELYTAPLESPLKRALGVRTGTGIWVMDFADKFPDCHVIGTDLSAIQPTFLPLFKAFRLHPSAVSGRSYSTKPMIASFQGDRYS